MITEPFSICDNASAPDAIPSNALLKKLVNPSCPTVPAASAALRNIVSVFPPFLIAVRDIVTLGGESRC